MSISITSKEKAILQKVKIPPRPEILLKITEEANEAEPNVDAIAGAIAEDVSISGAVLQIVNSAAFRRAAEIKSIQQAVMMLGLKRIFPIVKTVALKSAMPNTPALDNFWEEASQTAQIASLISKKINKSQLSDHAYMLGLFQMAGVPVMLQAFDGYEKLMSYSNSHGWHVIAEQESKHYNTSHSTIGAALAHQWKLPKALVEVIYYLYDLEGIFTSGELEPIALDLLAIIKLARHVNRITAQVADPEWDIVKDEVCTYLDIDDIELEELLEQILTEL